jgi:hypothetical protein
MGGKPSPHTKISAGLLQNSLKITCEMLLALHRQPSLTCELHARPGLRVVTCVGALAFLLFTSTHVLFRLFPCLLVDTCFFSKYDALAECPCFATASLVCFVVVYLNLLLVKIHVYSILENIKNPLLFDFT